MKKRKSKDDFNFINERLNQIKRTMTVAELRDFLEDYDDETPVYLSFDNGYTYGGINEEKFELEENYDEED